MLFIYNESILKDIAMFLNVLPNLGLMVVYIAIGFILTKTKLTKTEHGKSLSAILVYVLNPCMIISSFLRMEFSKEGIINLGLFFAATFVFQLLVFIALFLIFRKKFVDPKYRILTVGSVLGNVGFFGMPLICSIFPEEPIVACYSCAYIVSMNILVFTAGTYMITNDRKYMSLKSAFLNSTVIGLLIGLPLYIFKVHLPSYVSTPIELLGKMVTPVCMIVLGMRLAASSFKKLFTRPFVYIVCAIKLVIFPLLAYLSVVFIPGLSTVFKVSMFVLSMTPAGVIINSLAELHQCEQELSANVVLVSTLLCIATIPLLLLIVA